MHFDGDYEEHEDAASSAGDVHEQQQVEVEDEDEDEGENDEVRARRRGLKKIMSQLGDGSDKLSRSTEDVSLSCPALLHAC